MALTPFMYLELPVPSVTLGPLFAEQNTVAFQQIDSHDHSDGKGTRVKTAGLDINADLDFNDFRAFGLMSVKLEEQLATLTGAANAMSVFSFAGDLYYTSGGGTAIQLTSGGSIVSTPSALETIAYNPISTDVVLTPASTEVVLAVDTSAARSITLPSASAISAGRVFVIKDATGNSETFAITVLPDGSDTIDGALSQSLNSNYGGMWLITNGIDRWSII